MIIVVGKVDSLNRTFSVFSAIAFHKHIRVNPISDAVVQRCSVKKVFSKVSQNSQENICARVSFLIKFSCEFCETFKNSFFHRTSLVAASVMYTLGHNFSTLKS